MTYYRDESTDLMYLLSGIYIQIEYYDQPCFLLSRYTHLDMKIFLRKIYLCN